MKERVSVSDSEIEKIRVPWQAKILHVPDHVRIIRIDSNSNPINSRRGNNEEKEHMANTSTTGKQ